MAAVLNLHKQKCKNLEIISKYSQSFRLFHTLPPIRFRPYNVRKSLGETLIISKIRYFLVFYSQPPPKYRIQRLQKTQNRVASYVLGRYVKEDDLIKTLSWLPITELVDFCIANCCFSALHDPNWPKYLPIKLQVSKRTTRKDNEMMVERGEKNTFSDQVFTTFNDLPKAIRIIDNKKVFYRESKKYCREIGLLPELCLCNII